MTPDLYALVATLVLAGVQLGLEVLKWKSRRGLALLGRLLEQPFDDRRHRPWDGLVELRHRYREMVSRCCVEARLASARFQGMFPVVSTDGAGP